MKRIVLCGIDYIGRAPMKIAIIGSGIAGLGAAYLLHPQHELVVYEKNAYAGGHSRTITVPTATGAVPVDTGFIVFNKKNYPHLTGLFARLQVEIHPTTMSFAVSINQGRQGWFEYSSQRVFAQRRNLLRPQMWGMLADILRFNRQARRYLTADPSLTLGACLTELGLGDWFRRYYIQAMGAAIWSCSSAMMLDFPAATFLRFFDNHGLLTVNDQPQWYSVVGGSRCYVDKLTAGFTAALRLNTGVRQVTRSAAGVTITDTQGGVTAFDRVIFACHADEALRMLAEPSAAEQRILGAFQYQPNRAILHSDPSVMPRTRRSWASWNYQSAAATEQKPAVALSYWMNQLQRLPTAQPFFVTLNPDRLPDPALTYDVTQFTHPVFTAATAHAQPELAALQGQQDSYFCGAYQRYGFHEDGLWSAVSVAAHLGVPQPPWH
jgi:uncharacterized protein